MQALTPAERRGALVVVLLLALGAGRDLWVASRPLPVASGRGAARAASAPAAPKGTSESAVAPSRAPSRAPSPAPAAAGVPLDLNRASALELDALPGIGPVLAARIVAQRERVGGFTRSDDLLAVRGIGPKLFAKLRERVTVAAEPGR